MIIDFALASQRLEQRRRALSGHDFCGPCYDATGFVAFLVPHKVYPDGVGYSCPECCEVFE